MTYSDVLTKYYSGKTIKFASLNKPDKYIWKFLTFLEKYRLMPWDWDTSWKGPKVLTPKLQKDIICRELLEAKMNNESENKQVDATTPPVHVNKNPYFDTTGMSQELIDYNTKMYESIPPQDRGAVISKSNDIKNEKDAQGNFKPIKNKEDLASLLGTDPSLIEVVKEDV